MKRSYLWCMVVHYGGLGQGTAGRRVLCYEGIISGMLDNGLPSASNKQAM